MTEQAALLAAILADPADDAWRLQYADWLDEHEQGERAAYIRKGIANRDDEYQDEVTLEGSHWNFPVAVQMDGFEFIFPCSFDSMVFRRGFISHVTLSWSDCERHLDAILAEHPVEAVTLTTHPPLSFNVVASGGGKLSVSPRWPRIAFTLPTEPRTSYVGTPHGRAGWMEINGHRVPLADWRLEINPEAIEEAAEMPDDEAANPGLRRETAAERARSMEFAGRHRRRR